MELQQLRYVVAVAEERNFTRAAERCMVVQSALSHQVARLERELGAKLFERTSRRVRPTPAGEAFLPAARQALEAAERARAEAGAAAGEVRGRLRLGAIPTVTAVDLPALLGRFRERYPKAGVALRTVGSELMIEQVRRGELDAALLGVLPDLQIPGLRVRELATNRLVAIAGPHHRLAGRDRVGLHDLASEVFVDFPEGSAGRAQSDQAFAAAGLHREVAFEVTGADMMVRLVREGLGLGMVPEPFVPGLAGVRALAVDDAPVRAERLVWGPMPPSPAAAAFLGMLEEAIAGREAPGTPGRGDVPSAG